MHASPSARALFAVLPLVASIAACSSGAPESSSTTREAWRWFPPPPPVPTVINPGPTCYDDPGCSFAYSSDTAPFGSAEVAREEAGCGVVYRYTNGGGDEIIGGLGSFCPDNPANRALLESLGFSTGYDASFCDQCMTVPPGELWVYWEMFIGPDCPTGCVVGHQPGHI